MKERLRKFMEGRYGADELNRFLTVCGWVLLLIGFVLSGIDNKVTLIVGSVLVTLSWALLIYSLFRTFSKRTQARAAENYRYFVCKNGQGQDPHHLPQVQTPVREEELKIQTSPATASSSSRRRLLFSISVTSSMALPPG